MVSTSRSCSTLDGSVFGGIEFGLRDITDCEEETLSCCIDDFAIFTFGVDGGFKSPRLDCFSVSVANSSVGAFDELASR